jgi:hypothetical protein
MPGPLDQISIVVLGYVALVLLVAGYSALRWRERPPWLDSMAWMLEFLLIVNALAGLTALGAEEPPDSRTTYVGYLLTSVLLIPLAMGSTRDDRGPWSIGAISAAVLGVGVVVWRMMATR